MCEKKRIHKGFILWIFNNALCIAVLDSFLMILKDISLGTVIKFIVFGSFWITSGTIIVGAVENLFKRKTKKTAKSNTLYDEIFGCNKYLEIFPKMERYENVLSKCENEKLKKTLIYYKENYVDNVLKYEKEKIDDILIENPYVGDFQMVLAKLIFRDDVTSYKTWKNNQSE